MAVPTKANVSRPAAYGYDVLIEYGDQDSESLYLRAAVGPGRQLTFQTVEPQSKGPSTVENPEDMRSESGTTFSRSDFSGGEGLRRAHRRNGTDSDWSRFFDSAGVDVAPTGTGEPTPITLGREFVVARSSAGGTSEQSRNNLVITVTSTGTPVLYRSTATSVVRYSDPFETPPISSSTEESIGGTGGAMALLGTEIYRGHSTGIRKRSSADSGGSWAAWSDLVALRIWAVKGRILAADPATGLYEARASSGSVLLHTLSTGDQWTSVVDAGSVILAAADDGSIYHFAEEDGELVLVGQTVLTGEFAVSMAAEGGVVLIGTFAGDSIDSFTLKTGVGRLYRAAVVGQRLAGRQLIREWGAGGAVEAHASSLMIANRNAIVFAVQETASDCSVWRYDLATGSLHRIAVLDDAGFATGLVEMDDRLFVAILSGDLHRQESTYQTTGYLISPLADFYSDETKVWREVRLRLGAMPSGTSVSLAYSTDPAAIDNPSHTSWTTAINAVTTTGEHRADLIDIESRWIALKVTLTTSSTANTPEVLSFAARGLLKPTEMDWQIPINVSDRLELPHRRPQLVPGLGEQVRDSMLGLVGKVATVTLLRPDEQVVGQITGISEPIQEIPERGSPSVYALLQIRGERQT